MPRTATGLTDDQLDTLRGALAAGNRRPRVAVSAQQFGGPTTGQVVAVGDPTVDGPEYVSVRVTLDGLTDVLRFTPAELSLPGSRAVKAVPVKAGPAKAVTAKAVKAVAVTAKPVAVTAKRVKAEPVNAEPPAAAPVEVRARPSSARPDAGDPSRNTAAQSLPTVGRARRGPASVAITVSGSDNGWTITATRNDRAVLRPTVVSADLVARIAAVIDRPAVTSAVADVNAEAVRDARVRADKLRAELAAVEAFLAGHHSS